MQRSADLNRYALISVSEKEGIAAFAKTLVRSGYTIVSTGGTAEALAAEGIHVTPIEKLTGTPESFDGRMKTISFAVEAGILFDRDKSSHIEEARRLGIPRIDVVVCNLYPFVEVVRDPEVLVEVAVEQIDVGGPTMVRSAAKNFRHVVILVEPRDYTRVGEAIAKGALTLELRQELAAKAFAHLSYYDSIIARFLRKETFPEKITLAGVKYGTLRYGENPHQEAAFYLEPNTTSPLGRLKRLAGRELSMMNVMDINAGLEVVRLFDEPSAVVIKHSNPCGIALGTSIVEAFLRAIEGDPESAFGGVIVVNRPLDEACVEEIAKFKDEHQGNIDIVAAPAIPEAVVKILAAVRKTMGIYSFGEITKPAKDEMNLKSVLGGFLLQTADFGHEESFAQWETVTKARPSAEAIQLMQIGWKFISRVRSNAIIIMDKEIPMTRGIGTGQPSRVRAVKLALAQAGSHAQGGILVSDGFFPFEDSVRLAAEMGISSIVQPGGSVNDAASIKAADAAGIAMVFTHRRAFWH